MWQYNYTPESDELYHHGIKGMRWGKRRYQNSDGSLTPAGKKRYSDDNTTNATNVAKKKAAYDAARERYSAAKIDARAKIAAYSKTFEDGSKVNNWFGDKGKAYNKKILETAKEATAADDKYRSAKKDLREARKEYKSENKKTNEGYVGNQNFADKFIFNKATRDTINSYMNKGDSLKSARTKAYARAGANTVAILAAAYGGYKLTNR